MPVDPTIIQPVLIASIEGATLQLICTLFAQSMGVLSGLILAATFAVTWKG